MNRTICMLLISLCLPVSILAQLPDHNTTFIAHLNEHSTTGSYSGCWGYISPEKREYAILGTHSGTSFIDITNSSDVHEVDFSPSPLQGPGNKWREIKVYSHYAYVVTEQDSTGIEIYDLQYLPDSVHLAVRFLPSGYSYSHTISVSDHFIYLNGSSPDFGRGTVILDLYPNPINPVLRGSLNSHYVHDCRVINDTIWSACMSYGIRIIDAVNKDNPFFINSFLTIPHNTTHNCDITRDRKYIYTTDEAAFPNAGSLKIYDIQDLKNITFVREWRPTNIFNSMVHNVEFFGDTAVIAHYSAGIRVLDISNPNDPVEIAWYDTYPQNNDINANGCFGVFMFPSKKIIGSNKEDGLWVIQPGKSSGVESNPKFKIKYELYQNYPNPFNPQTRIKFDIPSSFSGGVKSRSLNVSLVIYDGIGRKIQTLVNEKLSDGSYEVEFDGSKISSGIYFYKLITDNYTDIKKMVLLK